MCLCVCAVLARVQQSHPHPIPSHPTLQCPLSLSLTAGRVRLNAYMGASEESLLLRGGGDGMEILQLREERERCPGPASNRPELSCSSIKECQTKTVLGKLDIRTGSSSRDGRHTVSRIPATNCSCSSRKLDLARV